MSYKELMLKFVGMDELREPMRHITRRRDYAYATDGHIAIRVPLSLYGEPLDPVKDYPNIEAVWLQPTVNMVFDIRGLEFIIDSLPKKTVMDDKEVKCTSCRGSGFHNCPECDDDHECRKCEGEGFITLPGKNIVGYRVEPLDNLVKIADAHFNPNLLMLLVEACKHEKSSSFTVLSVGEKSAMVVRVGEIELLIMPMRLNSNETTIHILQQGVTDGK